MKCYSIEPRHGYGLSYEFLFFANNMGKLNKKNKIK